MGLLTDLVSKKIDQQNTDAASELATYATAALSPDGSEQVHTHAVTKMLNMAGMKGKEAMGLAPALAKLLGHMHKQDAAKKNSGQAPAGDSQQAAPQQPQQPPQVDPDSGDPAGGPMPASLPATPAMGQQPAAPRRSLPSRILHGVAAVPGAIADVPARIASRGDSIQERGREKDMTARLAYIDQRTDLSPEQKSALKIQTLSQSQAPITQLGEGGRYGAEYDARAAAAKRERQDQLDAIDKLPNVPEEDKNRMRESIITGFGGTTGAVGTHAVGTPVSGDRFPGQKDVYGQPTDAKQFYLAVPQQPGQPPKLYPSMPPTPKYGGGDVGLLELANDPNQPESVRKAAKAAMDAKTRVSSTRADANTASAGASNARADYLKKGGAGKRLREGDINRTALAMVAQVTAPGKSYEEKIDLAIDNVKNPDFYQGDPVVEENRDEILKGLYALKSKRQGSPQKKGAGGMVRNPKAAAAPSSNGAGQPAKGKKTATKAMVQKFATDNGVSYEAAKKHAEDGGFQVIE